VQHHQYWQDLSKIICMIWYTEDISKLWRELQSEKAHLNAQKHRLEVLLEQAYEEVCRFFITIKTFLSL